MSSIIFDVLGLVGGLLWRKCRDHTANQLKEGDLTDEKCRDLIVRELNDIKTKLDGLARKDLLSSISFLEEGLCLLHKSVDKPSNDETPFALEKKADDSVLNEAWPAVLSAEATRELKIIPKERLESARKLFDKSNTRATEAFSNEALSVEDRILATKLQVISKILESLEDRDAAADSCKFYLTKLHDLPAIKEMFSVYLGGGNPIKSLFNKKKRFEHVMSVTVINVAVFNFTKTFTKIPVHLFNWPIIDIGERPYYPMLMEKTISCQLEKFGVQTDFPQIANIVIPKEIKLSVIATIIISVNSKGEIIAVTKKGKSYNVLKITASEVQVLCTLPHEDAEGHDFEIPSLTVDADDNIYVLTTCILFVFDELGSMKYNSPLEFLNRPGRCGIVVTKDKNIFIHEEHAKLVYVCDCRGQLRYSFPHAKHLQSQVYISISDENKIIAATRCGNFVCIYTEEGKLKRTFEVPEGHSVLGMVFNYVTKEVIVFSMKGFSGYYLSFFSKTGEQRQILSCDCFSHHVMTCDTVISHPNGPVCFVSNNQVFFLH